MKRKSLLRNEKGQVLGLPMYLIVIMIVAVAIIAAVIFMIPRGSQTMNASVTANFLISTPVDSGSGEYIFAAATDVTIAVITNDENADPISGATIILTGAGVSASATTDPDGTITVSVTPTIPENIDDIYIKMTVKATGYEDFEDDQAITVHRLS